MEEFYPSEIARLILGYLKEMKCETSWKTFFEESSDLQEYSNLFKQGKVYSTNVNGKSLLNILAEYSILKKEAMKNSSHKEYPKIDQSAINKNTLEIAVKNAIDQGFQNYFPALCNQRKDKCDDCVSVLMFSSEKNESDKDDATEGSKKKINNSSNIKLKSSAKQVCPLPFLPNINKVVSVDNRNFNDINSSRKESTLKSSNNSSKNEFSETACLETINVEAGKDNVTVPVISSCFSYDQENCDLSEVNTKLGDVIKFKTSNCKSPSKFNLGKNGIAQDSSSQNENRMTNSSTVPSESSNLGVRRSSTSPVVNMDDFVNASTELGIASNPISSQLTSVNELHLPAAVPTYILSNIPSSGSFIHNNMPYQLVINTVGSELYSDISTVSSNGVLTPKLNEPEIFNGTLPASSNPSKLLPKVTTAVASCKSLESACIKDQESAKRKKTNALFERKKKSKSDMTLEMPSPGKKKTPVITYSKMGNAKSK